MEINKESLKKLKKLTDEQLVQLSLKNLTQFVIVTMREMAITMEMKHRDIGIDEQLIKKVSEETYQKTLEDDDICSIDNFLKLIAN